VRENSSLYDAEKHSFGFTHCDSGKLLAEHWSLPPDIRNVIEFHHTPEQATESAVVVAAASLSDLLCRLRGMGYGYDELCEIDFHEAPAWNLLQKSVPHMDDLDIARFTFELDGEAEEIKSLVASALKA